MHFMDGVGMARATGVPTVTPSPPDSFGGVGGFEDGPWRGWIPAPAASRAAAMRKRCGDSPLRVIWGKPRCVAPISVVRLAAG